MSLLRRRERTGGGLAPDELASAAVMAAFASGATIIATVIPVAAAIQVVAVVPFGVVAHRYRLRAAFAAMVAGVFLAGLVAGISAAIGLLICALLGSFVGYFKRRGWGVGAVWLAAAVLGPLAAGVLIGVLAVFASYRRLVFKTFRSIFRGLGSIVEHVTGLDSVKRWLDNAASNLIAHWPWVLAAVVIVVVAGMMLVSWLLIGQILERLRWVGRTHLPLAPAGASGSRAQTDPAAVAPMPVTLRGVSVRYGEIAALTELDLSFPAGQFVAVVGDNGSGKSTLARILAGARPTSGEVDRAGAVGLGQVGGTAFITQRPDAQVVGLRVRDDIRWGLSDEYEVDVEQLLATVGLAGMADRETSTLSGGQLQRLAVASALARRPSLLISDESTAMIDPAGRRELIAVLAELPKRFGMTVIHITHYSDETSLADRVIRLHHGALIEDRAGGGDAGLLATGPGRAESVAAEPQTSESCEGDQVSAGGSEAAAQTPPGLEIDELGYAYGHGTVWEHRALDGVTLRAAAGGGLLIVGENGSGKSTLAWLIAGLLRPSTGSALIGGVAAHAQHGVVGIAFQHARLQLQRPTVRAEIIDAAGWNRWLEDAETAADAEPELELKVANALSAVGLPTQLAERSIEELSGGQQRRLAIAGLLARDPKVLVLDEPLAGLDEPSRQALVELLGRLREESSLTLIVVTHDPLPLAAVCPRTIRLQGGRLIEDVGGADREFAIASGDRR